MSPEEEEYFKGLFHLCPKCGRTIPPPDLDPLKILDWLLDNDPLIRRAFDLGRYTERRRADL
jgi:hypothetical protein